MQETEVSLQHVLVRPQGLLLLGHAQNISPRRHHCQLSKPPQLDCFNVKEKHCHSETNGQSPHLRSTLGRKLIFATFICNLVHSVTTQNSCNKDQPVNRQLCFHAHLSLYKGRLTQHPHYCNEFLFSPFLIHG